MEYQKLLQRRLREKEVLVSVQCEVKDGMANLQGQVVTLSDIAGELDDTLHVLHLALNNFIEVLLLHLRER